MKWFSRKKENKQDKGVTILDLPERLLAPSKYRSCPELLKASNICACIECSKIEICRIEKMAKGTDCEHFVSYCSVRDSLRSKPTLNWSLYAMKDTMDRIHTRYGTNEIIVKVKNDTEEEEHGKEERKNRTEFSEPGGCSQDIK